MLHPTDTAIVISAYAGTDLDAEILWTSTLAALLAANPTLDAGATRKALLSGGYVEFDSPGKAPEIVRRAAPASSSGPWFARPGGSGWSIVPADKTLGRIAKVTPGSMALGNALKLAAAPLMFDAINHAAEQLRVLVAAYTPDPEAPKAVTTAHKSLRQSLALFDLALTLAGGPRPGQRPVVIPPQSHPGTVQILLDRLKASDPFGTTAVPNAALARLIDDAFAFASLCDREPAGGE